MLRASVGQFYRAFGGEYLQLTSLQRIFYTGKLDDPELEGVIPGTVDLRPLCRRVHCAATVCV